MKMRAARMHGYREPLRLEEIEVPDFGPDEVLIKVAAAGVNFDDINDSLEALGRGDMVGRAVAIYD
ncbi:hypothetical protein [Mycobacterium sp.]|uniref:hypothetical protein n=1 Tax=Mycobacterium sp. TaxID=1785 RepID=UPI002CDF7E9B|nr:hypothetical protein [Mycobacterium sp.]HTQ22794.1 hypothetical protein [Mycobacterium sp.]